jgi:uncharacterized protein YycO
MPAFQRPIALDPGVVGGRCIDQRALQSADLIVSTTRAPVSWVIRVGTHSVVSHAALYIGGGQVIEAIGEGVVRRGLMVALADDALAVAYRSPAMNEAIAQTIVNYASSQVGLSYTKVGAVSSANFVLCRLVGSRPASFFCSQLVFESYRRGGLPLSGTPSQCISPKDAVVIAQHQLTYVGHLLGNPAWFPVVSP